MAHRRGYSLRKVFADLGLERGAGSTYRPPRRPGEPDIVMTDERLRVRRNIFWFGAAFMYGTAGAMLLITAALESVVSSFEVPADLHTTTAIAVASVAVASAGFWLFMASRDVPALPWMNVIIGFGTMLITILTLSAEESAPNLLTVFLLPAMAAAFYMPFWQAIAHLSAITVVEISVVIAAQSDEGSLVALNIWFFTMISAGLLMVARKRIQDGILQNVALAGRDPLTGVANLRKFNERIQTEVDRAERNEESLCLLMIDLDEFKLVNDNYSYTLGDAVLVASAGAMDRVVRANELLARRGGDEFAIIAVGADREEAEALAGRVREAVRRERIKLCPDVTPEASVGIAQRRRGESARELVRRADAALHVAKIQAHARNPHGDS